VEHAARLPETRRSDFTAAVVASHPAADRPECCLFLPHVAFTRTAAGGARAASEAAFPGVRNRFSGRMSRVACGS